MHAPPHGVARARMGTLLAVLALLLCPRAASPQRLPSKTFTAADGLGSSFVSDVMQDDAGFVWFATRDGLTRWNGYEFRTLTEDGGFAVPAVERVYQLRSGEYLAICNDGALYSYRRGDSGKATDGRVVFRRRSVKIDGRDIAVSRLYEDAQRTVWAGGRGVIVRDVGRAARLISFADLAGASGAGVTAFAEDTAGSLWIGTSQGLVRLGPGGTLAHYSVAPSPNGDIVTALTCDRSGRLWIGHRWSGLVVLNPGLAAPGVATQRLPVARVAPGHVRFSPEPGGAVLLDTANGLPTDHVSSLLTGTDGTVWVGTGHGLASFDGRRFTTYHSEVGLADDLVHSLCVDAVGRVWVATPRGATRIALEGFSRYTAQEGLAADRVVSVGQRSDGRVDAVGVDWSVNTFDGARFESSRLPLPPGSSQMWASQGAYRDREGRWWALANQGLFRFEERTRGGRRVFSGPIRVYTARDGLPSSHVFRAYQDRSGALWIGTRSDDPRAGGLARFDRRFQRATAFGPADGLPEHLAPSAFAEDERGDLWVGFYEGGVARYHNGRFRFYAPADAVPAGMVTALLVDGHGRLWISTNLAGIARLDDPDADRPALKAYTTKDGLSSNNVRALAEDRTGRIYAGTARGVDRVDPVNDRVRRYGPDEGLVADFVTSALRDSQGRLWFGTYGGVFRLDDGAEGEEEAPRIAITGVRINGERHVVEELGEGAIDGLVLDADQREVAIDFLSVPRRRARGVAYQYSLDPGNGGWSAAGRTRTVNFARLSPGRYRFAVRAVTEAGAVSPTPAVVTFTISPPVWQRWWVRSLVALALVGLGAGLYRYRVRHLLEMERLRLAIASDLHDEVATNLGSIATFGTLVRQELPAPSPFLERITVLAADSVEAIREIIWSIDPKPETVTTLLLRLHDSMVATCRARGMHLQVSVSGGGLEANLTPEQRKNVWLMLKEAVANAARHSGGTELSVTAAAAGRFAHMVVRDNGKGGVIPEESQGRGLATMKARAEALGGTMTILSAPGHGTTVEFKVRLAT